MLGARRTSDRDDPEYGTVDESWEDQAAGPASGGRRLAGVVLVAAAVAWIGLAAWAAATGDPRLLGMARDIALACVPLALIAILFVVLRGGNALRFGGNAAETATEAARLERQLGALSSRLAAERAELAEHGRMLMEADVAGRARIEAATAVMQADAGLLAREGRALEYAAAAARADLAVLLDGMPRLEGHARGVAQLLQSVGDTTAARLESLDEALAGLAQRGREVDETAGVAGERLAQQVARLEGSGEAAARALDAAGRRTTEAMDAALVHAAGLLEQGRAGIDAQAAALRALVEQARVAIERAGAETADGTAARLDQLRAEVDAIAGRLAQQDVAARDLIGGLNAGLRAIEGRFADLGTTGAAEGARLAATVQSIAAYAEQVREGLVVGGDAADLLVARASALSDRLEKPAAQIHQDLPAALARLEQQARRSLAVLNEASPHAVQIDERVGHIAARLDAIAGTLESQAEGSAGLVKEIDAHVAGAIDNARMLDAALGEAGERARGVAEGSTTALVEAMVRVRETAAQAAERAREAITAVIPDSVAALAQAGETALGAGVTRAVDVQVERLNAAAEAATEAASRAAGRLSGQLLQLAETTAAVEARVAASQEKIEATEREAFPRRAAHLIDALNSASIDVAKILSTEVTDTVWAAYLKGDRGIFTRRAVRLLENGDARDILRHYDAEPEFRDQVNRYVHDFEAMLRPILSSRDGQPMAVTLLGSDMGKLYVALAQAISRLRN